MQWDLSQMYTSFEAAEFQKDYVAYQEHVSAFDNWSKNQLVIKATDLSSSVDVARVCKAYIEYVNALICQGSRLLQFASLTLATDLNNTEARAYLERLQSISKGQTNPRTRFQKWLHQVPNKLFDAALSEDEVLKEHAFYLEGIKERARYALSDDAENVLSKMKTSGSDAWSQLQAQLTANLMINVGHELYPDELTLQGVRNLAFNADPEVREAAFKAELAAYPRIEMSSAAALNAIKSEVLLECSLRGYDSPLEKTLADANMKKTTLDAMLGAVKAFLPKLQGYQLQKSKYLGREAGLPFYDIHAPIGKVSTTYTFEAAKAIVLNAFSTFSSDLHDYAKNAFENNWIDVYPKVGKRSGAFCSGVRGISQSRIALNFTGSINNVITTAHELGHGYHGSKVFKATPINGSYSMPIAETASIFCETILKQHLIRTAKDDEKIAILDASIQGYAQTIMDIYSRYLFETELFKTRKDGAIDAKGLCTMMVDAQKQAYGPALDPSTYHPYMWANKVHYYYAGRNFYNFPYTFGLLFAKGLYNLYLETGEAFIPKYELLLEQTGSMSVEAVGALMGIDFESANFWEGALKVVEFEIATFIGLLNGVSKG